VYLPVAEAAPQCLVEGLKPGVERIGEVGSIRIRERSRLLSIVMMPGACGETAQAASHIASAPAWVSVASPSRSSASRVLYAAARVASSNRSIVFRMFSA
jgi:hypothetical protein